jgi:hypothetical protein
MGAVLCVLAAVVLSLIAGVVGGALTHTAGGASYTLSYADFVSIMLTAVSLLITLLAFFIALLAIIGWNAISQGVQARVETFLEHEFKEGNRLYKMLRQRADAAMFEGIGAIDTTTGEKPKKPTEPKEENDD